MATATIVLCGICEARHVTKCADYWCPECEEGLCSDCQEHHSLSKGTRKHETISIENYKNLPVFVVEISDNCKDHNMKFTNYCKQHDCICCPACLTTEHVKCTELSLLLDLIQNSKHSVLVSRLEDMIQKLLSFISEGMRDRNKNLEAVKQDQKNISDAIRTFRVGLNTQLDKLEQTLIDELNDIGEKAKSNMTAISTELSDCLKHVTDLEKNMRSLKDYGSDFQMFFGSKKIDKELDKEVEKLKTMVDEGHLNRIGVKVKLKDDVADAISKLTTFGSVSVDIAQSSLQLPHRDHKEAQIMSMPRKASTSIQDIHLTLLHTIEIPKGHSTMYLTGCVVGSKGNMMFSDYFNHRLIIIEPEGTFQSQIAVTGYPTNVTIIDDKTVAVSTLNNGIEIVDVFSKMIKHTIATTGSCLGITYNKGSLLWYQSSVGIQSKLLPDGDVYTLIPQNNSSIWPYLTTFEDKIFQTNSTDDAVTCYTIKGDTVWEYRDEATLNSPYGVTADNESNIYITTRTSSDVFVTSSDGKQVRKLLSTADRLCGPFGIHFDRVRNNLLIVNEKGPAFLYSVSCDI